MFKRIVFFTIAVTILATLLLGCSKTPLSSSQNQTKEENKEILSNPGQTLKVEEASQEYYGFLRRGEDGQYLISKFTYVLENDAEAIGNSGFTDKDFSFSTGYITINDETDSEVNFYPFEPDEDTQYFLFIYPDSIRHEMEAIEDGGYKLKEVDKDIFREAVDDDYYGFYKVKVSQLGDKIVKIEEFDEVSIFISLYETKNTGIINNGGNFVKYKGDIYYREYNEYSFEKSTVWGYPEPAIDGLAWLVRLKANGEKDYLYADNASGEFFIYDDGKAYVSLISQDLVTIGNEEADYYPEGRRRVYGRSLDGDWLVEYDGHRVLGLSMDQGLIITHNDYTGISVSDIKSGHLVSSFPGSFIHHDPVEDKVYYSDYMLMDYDNPFNIFVGDIKTGQTSLLINLSRDELTDVFSLEELYGYPSVKNIRVSGDYVWIMLASYEGTGMFFEGYGYLKIKKDGSYYVHDLMSFSVDWNGVDKPFNQAEEGPYSYTIPYYAMHPKENPFSTIHFLSEADFDSLGHTNWIRYDEIISDRVDNIEYLDGDIFFTVASLLRDESADVGWRFGYARQVVSLYRKNIESGQVTLIYQY